jgi:hypothetical protein
LCAFFAMAATSSYPRTEFRQVALDIDIFLKHKERNLQHKRLIHDLLNLLLVGLDSNNTVFSETPSSVRQDGNGL